MHISNIFPNFHIIKGTAIEETAPERTLVLREGTFIIFIRKQYILKAQFTKQNKTIDRDVKIVGMF